MFDFNDVYGVGTGLAGSIFNLSSNSRKRKYMKGDITNTAQDLVGQETLRQGAAGVKSDQPMQYINQEASKAKSKVDSSRSVFDKMWDSIFS